MPRLARLISGSLALWLVAVAGWSAPPAFAAPRSVGFKNDCPVKRDAIKRSRGGWTFEISHGDVGGCPTDNRARHSAIYWERAELRSSNFTTGRTYEFSFEAKFDPAARSSHRTTFFQIHSWNRGCTGCGPMLMIKANSGGSIGAHLQSRDGHHARYGLGITRNAVAADWRAFKIRVGTSPGFNRISIWVDGRKVLSDGRVFLNPKGKPYLKIGLYRPGSSRALPTDRVSIRKVRSERIE